MINTHIVTDIISRLQVSPLQEQILKVIDCNGNIFGQNAEISNERLAAETHSDLRECKRAKRGLEDVHLLRVQRRKIGPKRNAVNVYSIVRPWLKELSYHDAYLKKLQRQREAASTAHLSSGENSPPVLKNNLNKRENRAFNAEDLHAMGKGMQFLDPGGDYFQACLEAGGVR